ncbi:MAG: hypothetical protein ACREE9_06735 [Stellaceae bacterium]
MLNNLRRGFLRLGLVLATSWFVYWTCAYIISPQTSENSPTLVDPTLSPAGGIVLIAVAVLGLWWIVSGLRSN